MTTTTSDRPATVLTVACLAQFLVVLDVSVVNIALPDIDGDLGLGPSGLSWILNAYTLAYGGLLLSAGRLVDLVGRRRMLLAGLVVFGVASVAAGLAGTGAALVAARAAQGLGGAMLSPATLAVLTVSFAEGRERSRALGTWSAVGALGGAAGGVVGGVLVQFLGWRWIFLINLPVVVAAVVGAVRSLPGDRPAGGRRPDLPGAVLGTLTLLAVVAASIGVETGAATPAPWLVLAGAAVLGGAFVVSQRRARDPLVPGHVLRRPGVRRALTTMALLSGAVIAMWFLLTLFLQEVLHLDPLQAGLAFLTQAGGIMIGARSAARLVPRWGADRVLLVGCLLTAAGLLGLAQLDAGDTWAGGVLVPGVLASVGMGLSLTPTASLATRGVPPDEAGVVSGLLGSARQVGSAIGLAVLVGLSSAAGTSWAFAAAAGSSLVVAALAVAALVGDARRVPAGS